MVRGPVVYGIDLDRVGDREPPWRRWRRRLEGRFPVDAFGFDPLLEGAAAPWIERAVSVEVDGASAIPEIGPAVVVVNRRPGVGEPLVVKAAIRGVRRRRARVVGYRDLPVAGPLSRRLGAVRASNADLGAVLHAGHLAIVSLGVAVRPRTAGPAPEAVLLAAIGHPVIPAAVTGGPLPWVGVPLGHQRVTFGPPLAVDGIPGDPLSAAELAEAARGAVTALLSSRS